MRLSPLEAYDTVMRFARDCGELPLRLAMHAAVAQSFRPVFLHLTKLNYLPEAAGDPSVESDVLLAPFCREIGAGYFDFDPRVRALLLDNLQSEYAAEGRSRLRSVAGFLISYLDAQERSIDSTQDRLSQSYIEVQRWIALSILDPDGAAQQLAAALNRTGRQGAAVARVQIGGLVNVLAAPLLRYPHLTDYALGVQALERGEVERAQDLLSGLGDLQVGPVKLRPARAVLAAWKVQEKTVQAGSKPREKQPEYPSCFIGWGRDEETRQFVHDLSRDLQAAGVDCHLDGEDYAAASPPLAGRQVLLLVISARAESTYELSQHADEAASAGIPIVTLSLDPPWDISFRRNFDAVGDVDFSDGRTAYLPGYTYALHQLLDLLRDQAGWRPKSLQNPWAGREFKNDVFISYSYEQGVEEQLHRDLQSRLEVIRGVRTTIWKDTTSIAMGESWSEARRKNVLDSAIFVPLVTPRYMQSEERRNELDQFVKGAAQTGGLFFQGRSRICPVFLGRAEPRDLPEHLRKVQGIRFPDLEELAVSQEYYAAVGLLAQTLRDTLELFEPAPNRTVHLASAASDVEPIREEVRRELQSHGYGVTESDLEGSSLSVHLIGDEYREAAVAQFDMVKNSAHRGFPILVWIKPGTAKDPNQREWIASIEWGHSSAEVLRTSVEELKSHILDTLRRPAVAPGPPSDGSLIYLQVYPGDIKAAALLARYLREQGFVVSNPLSAPPPDDALKAHQDTLQRCDATILYWGSAPETWVTMRHSDTLKFLSARETRCLVAIYSGPPWSEAKKNFRSMDLLLIGSDSVDPTALEPLIRQLRPGADVK